MVYRVVRARLRRAGAPLEEAESVVQDVVVKLLEDKARRLRSFEGRSAFGTWACVVAARVASGWLDKWSLRRMEPIPQDQDWSLAPAPGDPGLSSRDVEAMLPRLPPRDRLLLTMRYLHGASYASIGRALGVPENSVGSLLADAKARARFSATDGGGRPL